MSELRNKIIDEIARFGPIPFARFMDLCLYTPHLGYYERPLAVGQAGDFYTSVSVGNVFGELLAYQMTEWLRAIPNDVGAGGRQLVEAGAHDGRLALDILTRLSSTTPDLFAATEYWILEPSETRQRIQEDTLADYRLKVRWFKNFETLPRINGIFFSNELLDAFPVHRLSWNKTRQCWREAYVGWNGSAFYWENGNVSFPAAEIGLPLALLPHLPDGFLFEVGRGAQEWWQGAAQKLNSGKLLAVDYGFTIEELLRSGKTGGTLRAYKEHHVTDDLLANVGDQDLTAHVNFDAIKAVGEKSGLRTDALLSQSQFLTKVFESQLQSGRPPAWTSKQVKQFQTLTGPEHLGRFRVLVQSR